MLVKCLYCNQDAKLVGGNEIYKHRPDLSHKKFWLCATCDAFVGTHPGDRKTPLGTLAKAKLRALRNRAHAIFDPIWQDKIMAKRFHAYKWLSKELQIPIEKCHIGMFNQAMCLKAIEVCKKFYQERRNAN